MGGGGSARAWLGEKAKCGIWPQDGGESNPQDTMEIDHRSFSKAFQELLMEDLVLFHMNVCSLTKNFEDFNILLNDLNLNFDILAITELHIRKDSSVSVNLHLDNYSTEQIPTETSAGGII